MIDKDTLKEKIPNRFHTEPEFESLVEITAVEEPKNRLELLSKIEERIEEVEEWLKEHQGTGGTAIIHIRDKVNKLSVLKTCKGYVEEYL